MVKFMLGVGAIVSALVVGALAGIPYVCFRICAPWPTGYHQLPWSIVSYFLGIFWICGGFSGWVYFAGIADSHKW